MRLSFSFLLWTPIPNPIATTWLTERLLTVRRNHQLNGRVQPHSGWDVYSTGSARDAKLRRSGVFIELITGKPRSRLQAHRGSMFAFHVAPTELEILCRLHAINMPLRWG